LFANVTEQKALEKNQLKSKIKTQQFNDATIAFLS
jgi:hypothetical protein